jgi:hypothetical protein
VDTIIASTGAPNLGLHTSSVQAALGGGVRRKERSPNRITFDKHSSLTDLTQRSA